MAKKVLRGSIKVTRLDGKNELVGYRKIDEITIHGTLVTTFAGLNEMPVVMIDNDPAQRYTVALPDIVETAAIVGLRQKLKGEAQMALNDVITVRYAHSGSTYVARCQGKIASCTSCAKGAAEAVARKIVGSRPHAVVRVDGDRLWKIVEQSNE
ncbi:MAG: hypothetical protein A4E60_03328 [Syntrophorhabdus sp. PtaB.Bin047]|jgi:hypothetical protein|nr:MAG: hypothetical protein A4E60_03328 [Syntrophorhabdus sp. PtaB.Bin047]